jgi:hypothetical protein
MAPHPHAGYGPVGGDDARGYGGLHHGSVPHVMYHGMPSSSRVFSRSTPATRSRTQNLVDLVNRHHEVMLKVMR